VDEQGIRRYQLEELAKKLVLLEGHLANFRPNGGEVICCHCSQKHTFELQALAEESINIWPELAEEMRRLAAWCRQNRAVFQQCDLDEAVANQLSGEARGFRKTFMEALDRVAAPGTAQPATPPVAVGAASSPLIHRHSRVPHLAAGTE